MSFFGTEWRRDWMGQKLLSTYVYVTWSPWRPEESFGSLELELQAIMSHYMGAENEAYVL